MKMQRKRHVKIPFVVLKNRKVHPGDAGDRQNRGDLICLGLLFIQNLARKSGQKNTLRTWAWTSQSW